MTVQPVPLIQPVLVYTKAGADYQMTVQPVPLIQPVLVYTKAGADY